MRLELIMSKHPKLEATETLFNAISSGDCDAVKSAISNPLLAGVLDTVHVGQFEGHSALNTYDAHVTPLKLAMDNFNHIHTFKAKYKERAFQSLYNIVEVILESGVHPDSLAAIWDVEKKQCRYYSALDCIFNERNINQEQKYALIKLLVQYGASLNQPGYYCKNIDGETNKPETVKLEYFWSQLSLQPKPEAMAEFMVSNGADPKHAPSYVVNQFSALFNYLKNLYNSLWGTSTPTPNAKTTTSQVPTPQFLRDYKCNKKNLTPQKVANAIWLSVSSKGDDKTTLIDNFLLWAKNTQASQITKEELDNACAAYDWKKIDHHSRRSAFFSHKNPGNKSVDEEFSNSPYRP